MRTKGQCSRGFTLVEAMIVVSIVGVVSAIGFNALTEVRKRSAYSNATNDTLSVLRQARSQAFGTSHPHVVVLNATTGHWWLVTDSNGDFSLASFDVDDPAPAPDRLLDEGLVEAPAQVGPSGGWGGALPVPYQSVPANKACTFCRTDGLGAVTFFQNGTATLSGTYPDKGSISFAQAGVSNRQRVLAIVGRTGAVEVFEK